MDRAKEEYIEVVPCDDGKSGVLFDLYVDGEWIGSKRTLEQCEDRLSHYFGISAAIAKAKGLKGANQ